MFEVTKQCNMEDNVIHSAKIRNLLKMAPIIYRNYYPYQLEFDF